MAGDNIVYSKVLGVIPDGNRRYSRKEGISYLEGYQKGYHVIRNNLLPVAEKFGFNNIIIYGFSTENFKRKEGKDILKFEEDKLKELLNDSIIHDKEICVKIVSSVSYKLPKSLKEVAEKIYKETKNYTRNTLRLLIGYGVEKQILGRAFVGKRLMSILGFKDIKSDEIDLVIRTGNRQSLSGFPSTPYTEFSFFKKYWPEMRKRDFEKTFIDFDERRKKMGE